MPKIQFVPIILDNSFSAQGVNIRVQGVGYHVQEVHIYIYIYTYIYIYIYIYIYNVCGPLRG